MSDRSEKTPIFVGGLESCGKTSFICALMDIAGSCGRDIAAFKPFDTGLLQRNAEDVPGDGELFCRKMSGKPMVNLVSPYVAHEQYPIEMAFRRDGITIDETFLRDRIGILFDRFRDVFIELPPGLFAPVSEQKLVYEWMLSVGNRIVWIVHPTPGQLEHNLAEICLLKNSGCRISLVLNNASKVVDQDLLFYQWEKIESLAGQQIEGMIPFVEDLPNNGETMRKKTADNIPSILKDLLGPATKEETL